MIGRRAEILGAALAVFWLALFIALELAFRGPDIVFVGLFGLSPLVASAVLPPRLTAAFGVLAIGIAVWAGRWDDIFATTNHWIRVTNVVLVSTASVVVAAVRVRREERMRRVEAIADAAQQAVLPTVPAQMGALRVGVRYRSAMREAHVGGDFYDLLGRPERPRFIVGDVRGKGLPAVQYAAQVIRLFRQTAAQSELGAAAEEINDWLTPLLGDEDFVTAVLVEYAEGALTVANCGHHPPMLADGGTVRLLDSGASWPPLGLADAFGTTTTHFQVGARLLLYTDGLVEARNATGDFLPVELIEAALAAPTVEGALDALLAAALGHVGHGALGDDLALMLVERTF